MRDILSLDGSYGEGGGQILRTALSLSVISAQPIRLINIRAARPKPGLAPQHCSAVRAAAAICSADVSGDDLGSTELTFAPRSTATAGNYLFDVAETAGRGSAGSVSLVLQTLLIPLALVSGKSRLVLRGGTHVEWSPSFDFLVSAYFPILRKMAFRVDARLARWGWYPFGNGEIVCEVDGGRGASDRSGSWPHPLNVSDRGNLHRVGGRAVAANLPENIPLRMAERARTALSDLGVPVDIRSETVTAACAGAGIFLFAEYEALTAGFSALGKRGKPAEIVADQAVATLREHHRSNAAVEVHLADQLLLPLAVAAKRSEFTVERLNAHLVTNAWAVNQFGIADVRVENGTPCRVIVNPLRAKET
ncbi:MAG TPA: RNA 3'-terminal phosphate cyclase [Pseudolabrys sp.]|nr:RNA 3'-terminal phosphate cyclase [Pseudolabrys sp.]